MILGCPKSCTISPFTSQKEAREEAEVEVAVHQEDVAHHEAGVVVEEALEAIAVEEVLEVIAVAEALGAAGAQEGSAVVVAVAVDLGVVVVVVSEGHDMFIGNGKRAWGDHTVLKIQQVLYCNSFRAPDFLFDVLSLILHCGFSRSWFTGETIPSKDRIVIEHSLLSVDHVMTQIGSGLNGVGRRGCPWQLYGLSINILTSEEPSTE